MPFQRVQVQYLPSTIAYSNSSELGTLEVIEQTEGKDTMSVYWTWERQTKNECHGSGFSNVKWLDKDLLCFNFERKEQKNFVLFSIAAKTCVGSIVGDITLVLKRDDHIVCLSKSNDCYVLTKSLP